MTSPALPLTGITVVALEQAVAAPLCTRTLADLGARVIKVENPRGGDFARQYDDVVHGQAAHFVWLNRGKESVAIDVAQPHGREVLHRLLEQADVFVSNLAPGATERLGIGPAQLTENYPRLVHCEISGYGRGGPLEAKRAYDLLVQAESGACAITGWSGAPAKPGPPMADSTTGLYAAISILAALQQRARTDRGAGLAVSLFDTMAELMGYALTYNRYTGTDQEPVGMGSPSVAPYGAYRTADDQTVMLGTTNDREWQRLARDLLERPDLADDPRFRHNQDRVLHREAIDAEVGSWCALHSLDVIQKAADATGIGNSRYNTPAEVVAHPHLIARDRWRQVDSPGGPVIALRPPPIFAGQDLAMGAIPALGEHTETVLAELGLGGAVPETGSPVESESPVVAEPPVEPAAQPSATTERSSGPLTEAQQQERRDWFRRHWQSSVPFHQLCGVDVERWDSAGVELVLHYDHRLSSHPGLFHGGMLATLIDSAGAAAVLAGHDFNRGSRISTVAMSVQYLAVASAGEDVRATATAIKRGRLVNVAEVSIAGVQSGRLLATGQITATINGERSGLLGPIPSVSLPDYSRQTHPPIVIGSPE